MSQPMKVLLVDDHSIIRFGVRQLILQRWPDAQIEEARSLAAALVLARSQAWTLAVTDLSLPDAQGIECVVQLRRAAPALPLLVLSLHSEAAYATQVMRHGAMGYMTKDHAPEELVTAIERVARGERYISASMAEHMARQMFEDTGPLAHEQLAPQEYRVMLQLAAGLRIADIAQTMHLSPKTVSTYRARIMEKLNLSSNVELVRYCLTHQLGQNLG
jgi:two-component system, NarL family, invasion response regulator UvrY